MEGDHPISCVFKDILQTCNTLKRFDSKTLSTKQQSTIIRCSQERDDHFFPGFTEGISTTITRIVMLKYTSKQKINRYLKNRKLDKSGSSDLSSPPQKRLRRYV